MKIVFLALAATIGLAAASPSFAAVSHANAASSSGKSGEGADATRAQALVDPGGLSPARAVGASRVPQPRRSGASACSAEGRSATRSDPQHPHWRTQWPGQAVGGSKPELPYRPTERRISQPAAAGRRTEDASPRLRVAGVRSPRAAYRADPGASFFRQRRIRRGDASRKSVKANRRPLSRLRPSSPLSSSRCRPRRPS